MRRGRTEISAHQVSFKTIMPKTYSDQLDKARRLCNGLRNHLNDVARIGISAEQIAQLEAYTQEADKMNDELDALRATVRQKASAANSRLLDIKSQMKTMKQAVKLNYDQSQWLYYGIPDKR